MIRQELEYSLCDVFRQMVKYKESIFQEEIEVVEQSPLFIASLTLQEHPMLNVKKVLREKYYNVIKYFVLNQNRDEYVNARLRKYGLLLIGSSDINVNASTLKADIIATINCKYMPWRKKYRYGILSDIALVLIDKNYIAKAYKEISTYMQEGQHHLLDEFKNVLYDYQADISRFVWSEYLINQYKSNIVFLEQNEVRIIVSATMSAGKSTLINALIGKKIAKTSQEVCTGNKCYISSKPYEDNVTYLRNDEFYCDASNNELESISWNNESNVSTYFRLLDGNSRRICFIDTPGVNSAINRNHGRITKKALVNERFDKVVYVLNANKLGTEEEMSYLKWFAENVEKNKVIFVLNKIDDFIAAEDDIAESIYGVKNDLISLGFKNPIICPISAYFSLLLKMKAYNEELSEDEEDEYQLYVKKFNKPAYDLSEYYLHATLSEADGEMVAMSKKCGLYGLEKMILRGAV